MIRISLILILIVSFPCFAQIEFQKGNIITANGERKDCLIKNNDWLYNPEKIEFRFSESGEIQEGDVQTLQSFQVDGFPKYVSASVDMDMSPVRLARLDFQRNPKWEKKHLFLKTLAEGSRTLLVYVDGTTSRFFYRIGGSDIKQLVYKQYYTSNRYVSENKTYLQQIKTDVYCAGMTEKDVKHVKYDEQDLLKYFRKVQECNGELPVSEVAKEVVTTSTKKKFNLSLTPGVTFSSFAIRDLTHSYDDREFSNTASFRIGAEPEFIFGFSRNKWSVFVEPSLISYSDSDGSDYVNYSAIEFPLGIRHYFYFNHDFAGFLNAIYVPHVKIGVNYETKGFMEGTEAKSSGCVALGAGVSRGRLKVEARYYGNTDILKFYYNFNWYSDYKRFSVILGFRIVKK